jgi:hypothetical protein
LGSVPVAAVQTAVLPVPVHCRGVSVPFMPHTGPCPPLAGAFAHSHRRLVVMPVAIDVTVPSGAIE